MAARLQGKFAISAPLAQYAIRLRQINCLQSFFCPFSPRCEAMGRSLLTQGGKVTGAFAGLLERR